MNYALFRGGQEVNLDTENRFFFKNFLCPRGKVGITTNCQGKEHNPCPPETHRAKGCFPKDGALIAGNSVKTLVVHRCILKCQ